ncbi:hypothetical protein EG329_012393 [Mollisiaceae sp. DMI_Dod_QoI]|nr:hypothetical protein EG329_012393 [Helotiales sp. DMI_Dod_QoI]
MKVTSSLALAFAASTLARYFPPQPVGVTTLNSERIPGVSISYKETHLCETTQGVKSYSGYVNLPASVLQLGYNISTFFWYFTARNDPGNAPLIIYLAGGPGESSMFGATGMGGPCYINEDANSTSLNPWSFNNEANVLYIDQPAQTGFSYDVLVNGTLEQISGVYTPTDFSSGIPPTNATFLVGTFPSQLRNQTANSSIQAAHALYQFTQAWVNEFPKYNTKNTKINLWANSWGGFYGPATLAYFEERNDQLKGASSKHEASILDTDTLGLLNGCIDPLLEIPYYLEYAVNNTYHINSVDRDSVTYNERLVNLTKDGGCLSQLTECRKFAELEDPLYVGNNLEVNQKCTDAFYFCWYYVEGGDTFGARSAFDISHAIPDPYPYTQISTFFNRDWVQSALGVPLNFSAFSVAVWNGFVQNADTGEAGTGDAARSNKTHVEYLLSHGKKVVMVYGDRDSRCNWLGAENVSLSLEFPGKDRFAESGYAELITNASYIGGVTRQAGNLAFNRIFESGHYAAASQPETVYRILERSMRNMDIATGEVAVGEGHGYQTTGPMDSWSWNNSTLPPPPPIACSTWAVGVTCTDNQINALQSGTAIVVNDVVISPAS